MDTVISVYQELAQQTWTKAPEFCETQVPRHDQDLLVSTFAKTRPEVQRVLGCHSVAIVCVLQQIVEQQTVNTQAIAGINQALGFLVSEFIRPNAQQALANYERLDRTEGIVADSAQQLSQMLQRLNAVIALGEANQQQISQNTATVSSVADSLAVFDSRLEETRSLVASNASQIAQLGVKIDSNASQIAQLGIKIDSNASQVSQLREAAADSRAETEALKEITRSQLAGIIGNAQRISRLEQQAS